MLKGREQGIRWVMRFFLCTVTVCIAGSYVCYGQNDQSNPGRYRVFSLRNIPSSEGRAYLERLNLGTVSQLPAPNTLLLTAQSEELGKATSLLKLVDSDEHYVIKALFAVSETENLPSNEDIARETGDISIGSFSNPPAAQAKNKAIIDIHEGSVVVIAPERLTDSIIASIVKLQESAEPAETEPNKAKAVEKKVYPRQDGSGELFNKLLDSIANAETDINSSESVLGSQEVERRRDVESLKSREAERRRTEALSVAEKRTEIVETQGRYESSDVNSRGYKPESVEIDSEMLDLDLPEKLNITDLLGLIGEYLELDYMYDAAKIKGDVTLRLRGPIKVRDLYPLLESVLKFKGFVMARKGNLVTIVPAGEVLDIDPVLLHDEADEVRYGDVIITRIFKLKYVDPGSAKNLLSGMKLGVSISAIAETSTLIVTGYAYRMGRIEELLAMVDEPSRRKFQFRQLKYTMAKTLAPKIKTLAENLGTISVTIAAPVSAPARTKRGRKVAPAPGRPSEKPAVYLDADERTNRILMIGSEEQLEIVNGLIDSLDVVQQDLRTMRLYEIQHVGAEEVKNKLQELGVINTGRAAAPGRVSSPGKGAARTATTTALEAPVEEPQIVIVDATNSLLVNATAEQHIQIATIISYIDSETLERAIPYEIYPLENQDPEALAEVLQKLIQETVKDKEGKIQKTVKKIDEDIVIVPDENTFSIIVYASKKNQEWIRKLITTLDKRRPQVLIDVMLVEISKTDLFAYDLDLITKIPLMAAGDALSLAGTGAIFSGKKTAVYRSVGGTGTGFYADRHIEALLTLMQEKGYGRVLAQPRILVNDNEQGTIDKKTTLYIARTSQTGRVGDDTSTTADFFDKSYTFETFTSGIELTITPHISEGNLLRLEIEMSRSSQIPEGEIAENEPPPDLKEDNISTIVTVPDKSTIILGGILQLDQSKGGSKIPGLGDIPIIGGLFRTIDDVDRQTRLYIFVRANILRPAETSGLPELVKISEREKSAFERGESEFQKYQDWPGIEPEPMDPVRVLEAEE